MPAAAVIPAPIAYINVVAVKKLVVGFLEGASARIYECVTSLSILAGRHGIDLLCRIASFTVKKLECSKQAFA